MFVSITATWSNHDVAFSHLTQLLTLFFTSLELSLSLSCSPNFNLRSLQAVLSINPQQSQAAAAAGTLLVQLGRYEESIPLLALAAQLSPNQADVNYNAGEGVCMRLLNCVSCVSLCRCCDSS